MIGDLLDMDQYPSQPADRLETKPRGASEFDYLSTRLKIVGTWAVAASFADHAIRPRMIEFVHRT